MKLKYMCLLPLRSITKKNSQQLARVHGRLIPVQSKQWKKFAKEAKVYLDMSAKPEEPISYPCNLRVWYCMPLNKDGSIPKQKLDLVNLLEGTQDLLVDNGILEDDNVHIVKNVDGSKVVYTKGDPMTLIEIYEVDNDDEEVPSRDGAEDRAESNDVSGSSSENGGNGGVHTP